jgi:drug/metabolite transporter (DMT)-like permease
MNPWKFENHRIGIIYVLISAFLWGITLPIAKKLISKLDPLFFVTITSLLSAFFLSFFFVKRVNNNKKIIRKYFTLLVSLGFLGVTVANMLFFIGLEDTSPISVLLLSRCEIIFVILISYFIYKNIIKFREIFCCFIIFIGSGVIIFGDYAINDITLGSPVGDMFVIIAAFLWAITTLIGKKLTEYLDPITISVFRLGIGGIILTLCYFTIFKFPDINVWIASMPSLLSISIFGCALPIIIYYKGMRLISATETSILLLSTPLFAAIASNLIYNEIPTVFQIGGGVLVCGGIILMGRK